MRILIEAGGSLTAGYLIRGIQAVGHQCVASDIDPTCFGRFLADDFIRVPVKDAPGLWETMLDLLLEANVEMVLPSLDETLLGWSQRKELFRDHGIQVVTSVPETVETFQDKWLTYQFFKAFGVPTPPTSLQQDYPLVKPRMGRGAQGVAVPAGPVSMEGMISQVLVPGVEYSVDVLCDRDSRPVYIVPRKRIGVREGKSTGGVVVNHPRITTWVTRICEAISFQGPINLQCFETPDGDIQFIEINPRVAGGMALSFAATENWMGLLVDHWSDGQDLVAKPIQYGMEMKRYYAEVFVPAP